MEQNFVISRLVNWKMEKSFFDFGAETSEFTLYEIRWKLKLQILPGKKYHGEIPFEIHLIVTFAAEISLNVGFSVSSRWKRKSGKKSPESYVHVNISDLISGKDSVIYENTLDGLLRTLHRDGMRIPKELSDDDLYFVCFIKPDSHDQHVLSMHENQFPTVSLPCIDRLARDFEKAFSSSEHTDVILKCGDKSIPAHKAILSCRSEVFQAMFRNNLKESQEGIVDIMDVEPPVFEKLIHYIYTGNLTIETVESVCNIYKVAHKYSIEALKERCIHFIKGNLETDQACEVLNMADLYQDRDLKLFVMTYIIYRKEFMLSDQWLTFSKDNPNLAQEVFLLFVQKAKVV